MRLSAFALLLLASAATAIAQPAPFDMTPEAPPAPAAPVAPPTVPAEPTAAPAVAPEPAPAMSGPSRPQERFLLPNGNFVLAGENASRSWSVYLTPEQAASATDLAIGYQNALVIAPEASRLLVFVNGSKLIETPVASSDGVSSISAAVPANLLRPGLNEMRIEASHRHRTDCTIQSTYELWTEFDLSRTVLRFGDASAANLKRVDDLRATGVDADGMTRINLVVPAMDQSVASASILRLTQGLALLTGMPDQAVTISESDVPPVGPGTATIVVGTASELRGVLAALPPDADSAPTASFVNDPRFGNSTFVVSGPSWTSIATAIDTMVTPVDRAARVQRQTIGTRTWRHPEPPMLFGESRLRFSDLGIPTQEFSGRRFKTDFAVGVPADFFANAYGEANILLDAAYSGEVLPGSHIDVYVNDNIAATLPITTGGGEILRHLPIKVTLRHFKPGVNVIGLEAVLMTENDRVCAPGATALDTGRFVVFDTSEFVMPDYARIAQRPNLAALAGTGFPYSRAEQPVPVIIDRNEPQGLSAAATLMARLAIGAGRVIPVDLSRSVASVAGESAIFVSSIGQAPTVALNRLGISEQARTGWGEQAVTATPGGPSTEATFQQWRDRLSDSGWRGQISSLEQWLNRTFDVSIKSFALLPSDEPPYVPAGNANAIVAQQASPDGSGTWTLVATPAATTLEDGVRSISESRNWRHLGGRISAYDTVAQTVERVETRNFELVETQPRSFSNYRRIAANWLSANALSYAVLVGFMCIVLGLVTGLMLKTLGRAR